MSDQNFVVGREHAAWMFEGMLKQAAAAARCPTAPLRDERAAGGHVSTIGNLEQWVAAAARPNVSSRAHLITFPSVVVRGRTNETSATPPRGAGTLCYFSTRGTKTSVAECMRRLYPKRRRQ